MAASNFNDLVRCNIDASRFQVQEENHGWPIQSLDALDHKGACMEPAVCTAELERLSHQSSTLVCEVAAGCDGAVAHTAPTQ